ncbi:MAG: hypothetical protein ACK515_23250 [bacterium]|jgi:hypothetical protein|nr:hypothetical protein [Betaproteobacteria bacterium]
MSGFLQRLLGHASDTPAGPVVRVQPAPAWVGTPFGPGVDAGGEMAGSEEPGTWDPDRSRALAEASERDPDGYSARRVARRSMRAAAATAPAAVAARMHDSRGDLPVDGAAARQGAQVAVAGAPVRLQSSTADRARHVGGGPDDEGAPVRSIDAAGADALLLRAPSLRRTEVDRLSASRPRTDSRAGLRNGARDEPRGDARATADGASVATSEPVVHVTIGRIDLVAHVPAAGSRPAVRAKATVPLSEYLRGTPGGRG